jgi:hypothetical protein
LKILRLNENIPADKSHYLMVAIGDLSVGEPVPLQYPGAGLVYVIEGTLNIFRSYGIIC